MSTDCLVPKLLLLAGISLLLAACPAAPSAPYSEIPAAPIATSTPESATAQPAVAAAPPTPTPTTRPPTPTKPPTPTRTPTPKPTATPTASPTAQPDAEVVAAQLNLRSGPGTDFDVLATLTEGDALEVLGQSGNCAWLKVRAADGAEGWVACKVGGTTYASLNVPCNSVAELVVATPTPRPATPTPVPAYRPPTSLVLDNAGGGRGELLIRNGTDADALVVVATLDSRPVMAAYIRTAEDYNLTGVPDGTYQLYFCKGQGWDAGSNRFSRNETCQRFDDLLGFQTTETQYTVYEVTLYGVVGGTASTEPVDPSLVPRP